MKETELFLPAKKWLEENDFEWFTEIQLFQGDKIVDIVGIRKKQIIAIELKTSFSLKVIEQATHNKNIAHQSYILTPYHRPNYLGGYKPASDHDFACKICQMIGIGVLRYYSQESSPYVIEQIHPRWNKHCKTDDLLSTCNQYRKDYEKEYNIIAGQYGGGHLTTYKTTIYEVVKYLKTKGIGGATIYDICKNVKTHYSGMKPTASLSSALLSFERDKIGCRKEGHTNIFFLREFVNDFTEHV